MFVHLDIIGITDEGQGFIIKEAFDMVYKELFPQTEDTIDVTVYVSDETGDAMGLVCKEDDFEYTIELNKKLLDNDIELFRTVCHETVHIAQYVKTDLIHLPGYKYSWKGSIIESIEYEKRPWEIEAYEYEDKFAWQYENSLKSDI